MDGGEEVIEYIVGPRGKVEVGESGVSGLVRKVYGRTAPAEGEANDEFEARLARSVGSKRTTNQAAEAANTTVAEEGGQNQRRSRRSTRGRGEDGDEDFRG